MSTAFSHLIRVNMGKRKKKRYNSDWASRSRKLRALTDHCVVCYTSATRLEHLPGSQGLVVHHLVYRGPRGSDVERPEDMVVMCAECHNELHRSGRYKRGFGKANFVAFREDRRQSLILKKTRDIGPNG